MNPRLPFTSPTLVALRLPSLGKSEVFFPLAVEGRADSRRLQGARRQRSVSRILAAGYQEAFTQIKDPNWACFISAHSGCGGLPVYCRFLFHGCCTTPEEACLWFSAFSFVNRDGCYRVFCKLFI
jgi:hypothetical protein